MRAFVAATAASAAALALIAGGAAAAQPAATPPPEAAAPAPAPVAGDPPDAAAALQAAAADTPDADAPRVYDPLEGFNRAMWGLNMGLDKVIVKPVSTVYRTITPRPARRGLSHVLSNLTEPFSFINGLLQGKPDRAFNSLGRFIVNTTIGVGGLADQASRMGMKPTPEDFGQTLARWGVRGGPYLVLPLLGPSTFRDGVGTGVAFFTDPYRVGLRESGLSSNARLGINAFEIVSARSDLTDAGGDTFLATSLDSYATARSAYLQRRAQAIADQDSGGGTADGKSGSDDAALDAAVTELKAEQGATGASPGQQPAAAPDAAGAPQPAPEAPTTTPPPATPTTDTPSTDAPTTDASPTPTTPPTPN